MPILQAMSLVKGGHAQLDAIMLWEYQAMQAWQMSEAEYSLLTVQERARRVVATKLPDWLAALENDEIMKDHRSRS